MTKRVEWLRNSVVGYPAVSHAGRPGLKNFSKRNNCQNQPATQAINWLLKCATAVGANEKDTQPLMRLTKHMGLGVWKIAGSFELRLYVIISLFISKIFFSFNFIMLSYCLMLSTAHAGT